MDASWFCRIAERQLGPLSWVQLQRLAARGELTPHSLVRRSDEITWIEAQHLPELWPANIPIKISDSTALAASTASAPQSAATTAPVAPAPAAPPPVAPSPPAATQSPAAAASAASAAPAAATAATVATRPVDRRTPRGAKSTPAPPPLGAAPKPAVPVGKPVVAPAKPAVAATGKPTAAAATAPAPAAKGVPAGVPVGVPVGAPVSGPKTAPASTAAAGAAPAAEPEVPLIFAPRPKPVATTGDAAGAKSKGQAAAGGTRSDRKARARTRLWIMVGGTGGVLAVLLIIVVAVLATRDNGKANPSGDQVQTADAGANTPADGATPDGAAPSDSSTGTGTLDASGGTASGGTASGGTTTGGTAGAAAATPSSTPGASTPATAPPTTTGANNSGTATKTGATSAKDGPDAAALRVLKSVSQWRDAGSVRAVTSPSARIQFTGVWFSGKRVCVEMRVTNPQRMGEPLLYTSWNLGAESMANPTVVLAAVSGNAAAVPLRFIPAGKAGGRSTSAPTASDPSEKTDAASDQSTASQDSAPKDSASAGADENERQTKPLRIGAGQSIGDVLEFDAPSGDFDNLQLALRLSAIGQGDRYLGFRIPKELIAPEKPTELVQTADSPRPAGTASAPSTTDSNPTPTTGTGGEPAPMTAAPKEETIIDLKKQIEQDFKKNQEEKDKARREVQEQAKKKAASDNNE